MFSNVDSLEDLIKKLVHLNGFAFIKNEDSSYLAMNDFAMHYVGRKQITDIVGLTDYDFPWDFYADHTRAHDKKLLTQKKDVWSGIELGRRSNERTSTPFFCNKFLIYSLHEKQNFILGIGTPIAAGIAESILSQQECLSSEFSSECERVGVEFTLYDKNLTRRQQECLYFLLHGKTTKEIAKLLFLSPRTVEGYIVQLKEYFNVSRRSELIAIVLKNGWSNIVPPSLKQLHRLLGDDLA